MGEKRREMIAGLSKRSVILLRAIKAEGMEGVHEECRHCALD